MREPYQIISIPYRIVDGKTLFCVFRRTDSDYWQFIAGGGENGELPSRTAIRETIEVIDAEPKSCRRKRTENQNNNNCMQGISRSALSYALSNVFPNTMFYVCPVVCMGITKDNWHKTEQGVDRVFGELARCGNQFVGDIKEYLL